MGRNILIAIIFLLLAVLVVLLAYALVGPPIQPSTTPQQGLETSSHQSSQQGGISISGIRLCVSSVSQDTTSITAVVSIENSFPVGVEVEGGDLSLELNDIKFASASIPPGQKIEGSSTSDVIVKIRMNNGMIDDMWYSHLKRGEMSTFCVWGTVSVSTPVGTIDLPVKNCRTQETHIFPINREPDKKRDLGPLGYMVIKRIRVDLSKVTPETTYMVAHVWVENHAKIPILVTNLALRLKLQDGTVIAEGYQKNKVIIPAGGSKEIVFDVSLHNLDLPKAWYLHIKNNEVSEVEVEVQIYVELNGKTYAWTIHSQTGSVKTSMFEHGSCG